MAVEDRLNSQANHSIDARQADQKTQMLVFRSLTWKQLAVQLKTCNRFAIIVGLIGYLLSPFSPYNDAIINIAPAYFLAFYTAKILGVSIAFLTAIYYVVSNLLGILLLWLAIRKLANRVDARPSWKQAVFMLAWIAASVVFLLRVDPAQIVARIGVRLG